MKPFIRALPRVQPKSPASEVDALFKTISELNALKSKVEQKLLQVDSTLLNVQKVQKGDRGLPGRDGYSPDKEEIIKEVIARLPKPTDEKQLVRKVIAQIPKSETKVINTTLKEKETDPLALIDNIMKLPKGKKLQVKHIEGLEQTISAFQNQLGRGYLHGSGITSSSLIDNEIVAGSANTFTLTYTPVAGSVKLFAARNRIYPTTVYTIRGAVITTVLPWLAGDLIADYRKA